MSDYDDYERREEFNRDMDRQYENFQEDLKFQHEESEATSKLAESLIKSGNTKAAAALYGYDVTSDAPADDDTTAAASLQPPSKKTQAREHWQAAVWEANAEREGAISAVNALPDENVFSKSSIVLFLQTIDPSLQADCKRLQQFMYGLVRDNSNAWLAIQPFARAVSKADFARTWVEIEELG